MMSQIGYANTLHDANNKEVVEALDARLAVFERSVGKLPDGPAKDNLSESCGACHEQVALLKNRSAGPAAFSAIHQGLFHLEHALEIVAHGVNSPEAKNAAKKLHAAIDSPTMSDIPGA